MATTHLWVLNYKARFFVDDCSWTLGNLNKAQFFQTKGDATECIPDIVDDGQREGVEVELEDVEAVKVFAETVDPIGYQYKKRKLRALT